MGGNSTFNTRFSNREDLEDVVYSRNTVKWSDLYNSEESLLEDLAKTNIEKRLDFELQYVCKGKGVIPSLKKQYLKSGTLSKSQMSYLKRLSREIVKYLMWEEKINKKGVY